MLTPSSKIFLFCSPLIFIGFVTFVCQVGTADLIIQDDDFWSVKNIWISFSSLIFGIILPLILVIFSSKINEAFYKRNPQLKIDIQKREEEIKNKEPNDPWKNLGMWSIIPIILGLLTYAFILDKGYLSGEDKRKYFLFFALPWFYLGIADLFIGFIKKIIGYTSHKDSNDFNKTIENSPNDLSIDLNKDEVNQGRFTDNSLESSDRYIGPLKSLELFFKNYFKFSGRSSRSSFWWYQLLDWIVIATVLELVDVVLHNNDLGYFYHPDYGGLLSIIWGVITLIPYISLAVRRLHDTNHSGWWLLIALTIIGIIPLIIWFCSSGTKGKNTYGPDKEAGYNYQ